MKPRATGRQTALPLGPEARPKFGGGGFVTALRLRREEVPDFSGYPFAIPAIRSLDRLELHPAVTFFIGENGSGKSTLLEALAVKLRFNAEGGSRNFNFATRETHSTLHEFLTLSEGVTSPMVGSSERRVSTTWPRRLTT